MSQMSPCTPPCRFRVLWGCSCGSSWRRRAPKKRLQVMVSLPFRTGPCVPCLLSAFSASRCRIWLRKGWTAMKITGPETRSPALGRRTSNLTYRSGLFSLYSFRMSAVSLGSLSYAESLTETKPRSAKNLYIWS